MVRTRDFVLVACIVLFVALFATTSIVRSLWGDDSGLSESGGVFVTAEGTEYEAVAGVSEDIDRAANRERLRALIANRDEEYIESDDSLDASPEPTSPSETQLVRSCAQPDDTIGRIGSWPLRNVSLTIQEGARVVLYAPEPVAPPVDISSTSAPVQLPVKTIVQLPLTPTVSNTPSCVPSSVVGVTTTGWPLFNNSVAAYTTSGPDTLVGYARDGFPIYGRYSGETDECGGYQHPTGYRYTLSSERNFIIGCFVGTPRSFILE